MRRAQGFTLLEMLIATTLLALVISVGNTAFGLFSSRWAERDDAFTARFESTRRTLILQDVIDSLLPYVVQDQDGTARLYFEGNVNGFVAMAAQGLLREDTECVVRLSLDQDADLTFRLLYEEWPLGEDQLLQAQQPIPFGPPLELASGLEGARFDYFGWASLAAKQAASEMPPGPRRPRPEWQSSFNALNADLMPWRIRLALGEDAVSPSLLFTPALGDSALLARHRETP
jgi:prepilin-type N-terminal cleavage/methylation domain-containing protein